ncbi:MAG: hypothetical protein IGS49_12005 [Chlorogloeopsis fritschii C42_A2020_084]|uniref:hypothetical protein n=1 Tax=Chlorogloeopsis fritschii TaxID=1124 RepID=UPI001A04C99E|nr:hypothetical protein [Chlorogloeopsis fritschii]MBF2006156.1 hypothetical protein [Chlorogloeopsis fritschii C42_A2020_084]
MNIFLVKFKTLNVGLLTNVLIKQRCTVDVVINREEFENLAEFFAYNLRFLNLSLFSDLQKLLVLIRAVLGWDSAGLLSHCIEAYKIGDRAQQVQIFLDCERGSGRIGATVSGG